MFERQRRSERVVLVQLTLGAGAGAGAGGEDDRDPAEFQSLVTSAGAECAAFISGSRQRPDPHFFVGSGKAEEIREAIAQTEAEVVIFDHDLSPAQERNLEAFLRCRVVDRTGLILDIFAQHARSFEGKLQVELAQLRHLSTRLVRGWTHLERQKGGIGLRGPGETQLETDRRLLAERIKQIKRRLVTVERRRYQSRQARRKAGVPTVSLVGYTNAGKSTLFNRLTQAGVYVADQLFATLDPTLRRLPLPHGEAVVLADTVGFIKHLPPTLVAAFRATLQETCEASLLLHVIDASDPNHREISGHVEQVLKDIGADAIPCLRVFNKIDRLESVPMESLSDTQGVRVSARSGLGIEELLKAIEQRLRGDMVHGWVRLPPGEARLRARFFSLGAVLTEQLDNQGEWLLEVRTSRRNLQQLCRREGLREEWLQTTA
ncbi:MAG: GTPase HflX [Gammaproteobacteria bacterium]|nr:GTPase HflX [Gammaproteobacteria bacterium]MCP5459215.1 GTPase HflX [Gammaproteobacteria bacterium]